MFLHDAHFHIFSSFLFTVLPSSSLTFPFFFPTLSAYLEGQMAKGELRHADATMTVQVLIGSVMGFVLLRQILHDPSALAYTHEQIAEAVTDIVLQGLLPR